MKTFMTMRMIIFILCCFGLAKATAQNRVPVKLAHGWLFSKAGTGEWYPAVVPGNIYTDLLRNELIPDPFFSDNEKKLQWIDSCDWIYKTYFTITPADRPFDEKLRLTLEGLDTYADVYVNNKPIVKADNMFREWEADISKYAKNGGNELKIYFHSALHKADEAAKRSLPLILPDNSRVYVRKAQFQFGWDWGPKFIGCGIWKQVYLDGKRSSPRTVRNAVLVRGYTFPDFVQEKDSAGESFLFKLRGRPVYVKGANWISANIFLPEVKPEDYRKLLIRAKDANMNMLRVWGGGVYEDDYFYKLCDSLHIMVWQDFMFAGGMYPADKHFLENVKEEVHYQVSRLKHHPCIVLWCGNNEIDEAWKNWGWQDQFKIHGADSARLWKNYKTLFEDSIPAWLHEVNPKAAYIPTSPKYGWGHEESFKEGDSHYWGLWWGLEPWENFETHTGRFVSEYGMQSMPNLSALKTYVPENDFNYSSDAVQWHQKANEGFKKLNFYLDKYFIDSAKLKGLSLEEYSYLTQCLQYYILKNSIAVQRSKEPYNMGTLLWQLNDCWPVTSWSILDFSKEPKAAWYAVKEAYRDDIIPVKDLLYPKKILLNKPSFTVTLTGNGHAIIESDTDAKYVFIDPESGISDPSDNYFDIKAGEKKEISFSVNYRSGDPKPAFKLYSLYDVLNK